MFAKTKIMAFQLAMDVRFFCRPGGIGRGCGGTPSWSYYFSPIPLVIMGLGACLIFGGIGTLIRRQWGRIFSLISWIALGGIVLFSGVLYVYSVVRPSVVHEEVISEAENTQLKTYQNEIYGFKFKYPQNWEVNDQSYAYMDKEYISVVVASPQDITGVPGASREAYFYIGIFKYGQDWKHEEGMNLSPRMLDGGPIPVEVSRQYLESIPEFKLSQMIWASLKINDK